MNKTQVSVEEIYRKYYKIIYLEASRRLDSNELVEEAMQDILLKISNNIDKITEFNDKAAIGYIVKIARYTSIELYRKEIRQRGDVVYLEDYTYDAETAFKVEEELAEMHFGSFVSEYIDKMSKEDNELIHLFFYDGYSYEQISKMFGITPEAARQRLHRAKKRLRDLLITDNRCKYYVKGGSDNG